MDIEVGHILPSFSLANALNNAGHEAIFLSVLDSEDLIRSAGFEFFPVFTNHYPKGFNKTYRELIAKDYKKTFSQHLIDFFDGSFDQILENIKPDILVVSSFFNVESLIIYYKYNIKPVILSPRLYDDESDLFNITMDDILRLPAEKGILIVDILEKRKLKYSSFKEIVTPINSFTHLIICSGALESKPPIDNEYTFYIGFGGDNAQNNIDEPSPTVKGKKNIYASMGSQTVLYPEKFNYLYSKLISIMRRSEMDEFHLFFSVGNQTDEEIDLDNTLSNVTVFKWANQMEILKKSSLAFIHGGLNTIKECIFFGVPMIIIPGSRDQPANAVRVQHHNIGRVIQIESMSEDDLITLISSMYNDTTIKENLKKMKSSFDALDNENRGVSVIEKLIADNMSEKASFIN